MSVVTEEPVVFECGGDRLVGILHRVTGPNAGLGVVMAVGGPQYRVGSHRQFVLMARALAAAGYPVMRFDYRGMGDSDGSPRDFRAVTLDLQSAIITFDAATGGQLNGVAMFGLCDAASAILISLPCNERVRAVAIANPWVRSEASEARSYVRHYYGRRVVQRDFWAKVARGQVKLFGSALGFFTAFFRSRVGSDALPGYVERMRNGLQRFRGPVMVLCSGRDLTAREFDDLCMRDAGWRKVVAQTRVSVVRIPDADHTFSRAGDLGDAVTELINWLESVSGRVACR